MASQLTFSRLDEMNIAPIIFDWNGEAMIPLARFMRLCDNQFVVGEQYRMEAIEERSRISHNHYFASIHDAWLNLPEYMSDQFLTETHLRKHALIKAGYADKGSFACASKAEAIRLAAFIKPTDEYAIITVEECVVTRYTAQSQSVKAMGKEKFQASKTAVLEIISNMIGVAPRKLNKEAGRSA